MALAAARLVHVARAAQVVPVQGAIAQRLRLPSPATNLYLPGTVSHLSLDHLGGKQHPLTPYLCAGVGENITSYRMGQHDTGLPKDAKRRLVNGLDLLWVQYD